MPIEGLQNLLKCAPFLYCST